jgi:hypothetical protein
MMMRMTTTSTTMMMMTTTMMMMIVYALLDTRIMSVLYCCRLTKLQTKESRDFRGNLKSTGQNKFALKEEDESVSQ